MCIATPFLLRAFFRKDVESVLSHSATVHCGECFYALCAHTLHTSVQAFCAEERFTFHRPVEVASICVNFASHSSIGAISTHLFLSVSYACLSVCSWGFLAVFLVGFSGILVRIPCSAFRR
jgi:hypothetical protein